MNLIQAETLLQTYLHTHWTATAVAYPNVLPADFAAPGQPLVPEGVEDYLALRYQFTDSRFVTVPGRCRRYQGNIYLALFVRRETGTRQLAQYSSDLIDLFEGREIVFGTEFLRTWGITGSVERELDDWYMREIAFGASFERHV